MVELRLTDGSLLAGRLAGYSSELPLLDRELLLGRPLRRAEPDGVWQAVGETWSLIVVPGSQVARIMVRYVSATSRAPLAGRSWIQSVFDSPRRVYAAVLVELAAVAAVSVAIQHF